MIRRLFATPGTLLNAVALAGFCVLPSLAWAQSSPEAGPIIWSGGAVYSVQDPDFETPLTHVYRVAFDVTEGSPGRAALTTGFESVARFMNMHGQAGVPAENLDLVLVVHGSAAQDLLMDRAYRERLGYPNPNTRLLTELIDAGVRVILSGQSVVARGLPRDGLIEGVEVALSAMTALQLLQAQGYLTSPL